MPESGEVKNAVDLVPRDPYTLCSVLGVGKRAVLSAVIPHRLAVLKCQDGPQLRVVTWGDRNSFILTRRPGWNPVGRGDSAFLSPGEAGADHPHPQFSLYGWVMCTHSGRSSARQARLSWFSPSPNELVHSVYRPNNPSLFLATTFPLPPPLCRRPRRSLVHFTQFFWPSKGSIIQDTRVRSLLLNL